MKRRRANVAALISVGVSAGVFFALREAAAAVRGPTRGDRGLRCDNVPVLQSDRPSSNQGSASAGLLLDRSDGIAMVMARCLAAAAWTGNRPLPLIVGGLFVNHLFAKAGLFWLAGVVGAERPSRMVGPGGTSAHHSDVCHSAGSHRGSCRHSRASGQNGI